MHSLFFLPSLASAAEQWTLVSSDFQSRPVSLVAIDDSGVKVRSGAEAKTVPWDGVLQLDRAASAQPGNGAFTLHLNGGDTIAGGPISVANDIVSWQNAVLGKMDIPEDRVNAIVRAGQAVEGLDDGRKTDVVRLTNGDTTTGIIEALTAVKVSIRAAGADAPGDVPMDKVAAVLFADPDPRAAPARRGFRVWISDGSSVTVPVVKLTEADAGRLKLGFTAETARPIDLAVVNAIEQVNGPVAWLTSLTPVEILYKPFLADTFPPRFDHPVGDETATIRQKFPPFRHGIGVHSYTKLTYAVPEGYAAFRTQFAIDGIPGSDMTKADVTVRLLVDGKTAQAIPHVRYGKTFGPVLADINGAKTLALEVDYGDNLDAQDRFAWLDPAFVRTMPPGGAAPAEVPATQPAAAPATAPTTSPTP